MLLRSSKVSFPFIWYASTVLYGTWPASVKLQSTSTRSSSSSIFVSSFLPTTALSPTRSKYQQLGITTAATGKSFGVVDCNQRTPNLIPAISTTTSRRMASSSAASDADTVFLKEKLIISVEDAIKLHGKSNVKFFDG